MPITNTTFRCVPVQVQRIFDFLLPKNSVFMSFILSNQKINKNKTPAVFYFNRNGTYINTCIFNHFTTILFLTYILFHVKNFIAFKLLIVVVFKLIYDFIIIIKIQSMTAAQAPPLSLCPTLWVENLD